VIYLDHHAATPLVVAAEQAMAEARERAWANPSSVHAAGREARALLERAREQAAAAVGAKAADIVLTSGGTEACNLGVRGLLLRPSSSGRVTLTALEHPAVRAAAEADGTVTQVESPADAWPSPEQALAGMGPGDVLAVQWVNHETGVVLPVHAWAERARARGAAVFVDATQALGKLPVDLRDTPFDAVAFAGQKVGGPAGTGALWVRRGVLLGSLLRGGGQERGRRPGTPNVLGHVGFGAACAALASDPHPLAAIGVLRDRLEAHALSLGGVVNGAPLPRVPTVTQVAFRGQRADVLVAALDVEGVCASAGAACSSGLTEPIKAVLALHPAEPWRATASVRFSLSHTTSTHEVELAMAALTRVLTRA
jgi:cysteine desulfurase